MKVTIQKPNITRYNLRLNPGDELYQNCLRAEIDHDHDTDTMTAESDCGSYSYGWTPTPKSESFTHLMARVDVSYLLGKIAVERFDFWKSKDSLYAMAENSGLEESVLLDINLMDASGEELYLYTARDITGFDWDCIPVERDYPAGPKVFARVFIEILQPLLRDAKA